MKKLFIVVFWIISTNVLAQETDKPYVFPVKPGSEQWAKLTTSEQMDEVCVVPDEVIESLSTRALLFTCLNYPRIVDVYCANNLQTGFEFYANHFNGLKELRKREDLNKILLDYYPEIDIQRCYMKLNTDKPSFFQVAFLELLLAQDETIKSFSDQDRSELLSIATTNLEKRRVKDESIGRQVTTALLLSRILSVGNTDYTEFIRNKEIYETFNATGIVLDTSIINEILAAAKKANSSYL